MKVYILLIMTSRYKVTDHGGKGKIDDEKQTEKTPHQPPRDGGESDKEESLILSELRELRKEHKEASEDTKQRLARVEDNMKDLTA